MIKLKKMLNEDKFSKYYYRPSDIITDYFKGIISVKDLLAFGKKMKKDIATRDMLKDMLNNKFMIGWKAEETGIPENQIIEKLKELLKYIKK